MNTLEAQTYVLSNTDSTTTADQKQGVCWILHQADRLWIRGEYEIKRCEVDIIGKELWVLIEVGLPNDAGTLAAVFGRDTRWFRIGPRGGVRSFDGRTWRKGIYEVVDYTKKGRKA